MERRTPTEPDDADVMSASDASNDAQRLAGVLQNGPLKSDRSVRLRIPLSAYLSGLDDLSHDDLVMLRERVEQRLAS